MLAESFAPCSKGLVTSFLHMFKLSRLAKGTTEKMSKNQIIDIWIQASKWFKTGRIFVFMGHFGKAGMATRKLKWNRLVSAGSFDERASTSAWNVSRQGLRVFWL